ncbi:hypothetical protein FB45DRAFT_329859 [Roridomyces roridus]|uniref:Uncharacterized protein n=1 Tax=Roridomyces roridus TaxID=1738132 RepID=A0AAD7FBX0_9AGAR|nr:hypothetical protein FB45DRAFT_329859 [Roridomyces roridus]
MSRRRLELYTDAVISSKMCSLLGSYRPHAQETCVCDPFLRQLLPYTQSQDKSLNALLLEFDQLAKTARNAFSRLVTLSDRVARTDLALFSERGKIIDPLNPVYDAYLKLVEVVTKAHTACAEYLFLRRKMCREGPGSVSPVVIDKVLVAFSRRLRQMSSHAAEIKTQWKATTDALRVVGTSYCMRPSFVSIISWVDSRNQARLGLPELLDVALPETMQKSTEGLEKLLSAYANLEDALNRVEQRRRTASEAVGSEYDFSIALFRLIRLDTAVLRYRACLVIVNRWNLERFDFDDAWMSSSPLRQLLFKKEKGFLPKYCGETAPLALGLSL